MKGERRAVARPSTSPKKRSAGRRHRDSLDPFERPLDRHLEAQRRGFGPDAYRPDTERADVWRAVCPRCASPGRTALVVEHADGGLSFVCRNGCERVADSARSLEQFWLPSRRASDGRALRQPQRVSPDPTADLLRVLSGLSVVLDAPLEAHDRRQEVGR